MNIRQNKTKIRLIIAAIVFALSFKVAIKLGDKHDTKIININAGDHCNIEVIEES